MDTFLTAFDNVTGAIVGFLWHDNICWVVLAIGAFFTIMTGGVQFRKIPEMFRLLFQADKSKTDKKKGLSNFQALMITVGGCVGTGNIAGTATAIFAGGPGAIFWMWMSALVGAASAFIECTLAQIYKDRTPDGKFIGGQAYYAEKGLGWKWYGTMIAVVSIVSGILGSPCVQSNVIAESVSTALNVPMWTVGLAVTIVLAAVIFGGIQRIADAASKIVPVMCIVYFLISIVLIAANISKLPGVIGLIFSSAFDPKSMFGGMIATALVWGMRRGIYSNEAGQGTGTAAAAAVDADHPIEQGLVQALSVFIDRLGVCSISAFCILITGCYNVSGPDGALLVENLPNVPDGIAYVQYAISSLIPFGQYIIAFLITTFAFTSLMSYYLEGEVAFIYITDKHTKKYRNLAITILRIIFLALVFVSSSWPSYRVWNVTDIGGGLLTWAHLALIVIISRPAIKALRDYDKQRKAGISSPVFDPVALNIKNAELWTEINKEKGRERSNID